VRTFNVVPSIEKILIAFIPSTLKGGPVTRKTLSPLRQRDHPIV
jgi:hypothetical protein